MKEHKEEDLIFRASEAITGKFGISYPKENLPGLQKLLLNTANELGLHKDPEQLLKLILEDMLNPFQVGILISNLTIGETFFFRDMVTLNIVREHVLMPLIEERRSTTKTLRIWSAACCSGEEPYTLAIMLKELIPDIDDWKIYILGTDLNRKFLDKARNGVYTAWSFRETRQDITEKYFTRKRGGFELKPEIMKMVVFQELNLISEVSETDQAGSAYDIIFCRNVLMYFSPEKALKVTKRLHSSLNEKGWLIISPVEISMPVFGSFSPVVHQGITLFRKDKDVQKNTTERAAMSNHSEPYSFSGRKGLKPKQIKKPKPGTAPEKLKGRTKPLLACSLPEDPATAFINGNYKRVVELALARISKGHETTELMGIIVKAYANLGELKQAREWSEKLISLNKVHSWPYYIHATIMAEMNLVSEAEDSLRKALYLDPGHVISQFFMGNISSRLGKQSRARKHYENALLLLEGMQDQDLIPESEGMTAGRLMEIISSLIK